MTGWKAFFAIAFLASSVMGHAVLAFAQSSEADISPGNAPGMQKTTDSKLKPGAATTVGITPAATGRRYPRNGELLIGQGDLLHIEVFDTPEFSQDTRVDASGNMQVNGIGVIAAENLSPRACAVLIQNKLEQQGLMLKPQVTVSIVDFISDGVSLKGEVRNPGIYPVLGQRRLSDLLAAAGGATELSDGNAEILRPGSTIPEHVFLSSDADSQIVNAGDVVTVERAPLVYVVGNVRRPGGFPLARPTSILQALTLAEGTTPSAKDHRSILFRKQANGTRTEIHIDLPAILRGKSPDLPLRGDDILYIPNSATKAELKLAAITAPSLAVDSLIYLH